MPFFKVISVILMVYCTLGTVVVGSPSASIGFGPQLDPAGGPKAGGLNETVGFGPQLDPAGGD